MLCVHHICTVYYPAMKGFLHEENYFYKNYKFIMETGICHYITGKKMKAFSSIQFFMQEYPLNLHY